jgi:hypothetical protein
MSTVVLTLLAPAALKEEIVDLLLGHEPTAQAGFVTREVHGHGVSADYYSVVEQIRGFSRQVEMTLTAPESDVRSLLDILGGELSGRGITYRIVAVAMTGTIP